MPSLLFEQELRDAVAAGHPRMSENQIDALKRVCDSVPDPPWDRKTTSRRDLAYYRDERLLTLYGLEAVHRGAPGGGGNTLAWSSLLRAGFDGRFSRACPGPCPYPETLEFEKKLSEPPAIAAKLEGRFAGGRGHPVQYVREWGRAKAEYDAGSRRGGVYNRTIVGKWEGPTQVDARAVWRGDDEEGQQRLYVEAKFLSDVSADTTYDAARNQIARTIEAGLWDTTVALNGGLHPSSGAISTDAVKHFWFLLLAPREFLVERPDARWYGFLMHRYTWDSAALAKDLDHVDLPESAWDELRRRIGWATWEDVRGAVEERQSDDSVDPSTRLEPGVYRDWKTFWDERGIGWVQHLTVFLGISGGIPVAYRTLEELRARLREQGFSHLQRREECILSGGHLDIREPIPVDELTLEDVDWPESDEFRYLKGIASTVS